jgi:putative DNA primase/helicase
MTVFENEVIQQQKSKLDEKETKKHLHVNPNAFWGIANHKDIFPHLLKEVHEVNFNEIICLPEEEKIRQKHYVFAVVKHILNLAKEKNWNLCKRFDYIYVYNGAYWRQCSKDDVRKLLSDAAIKMGMQEYNAKHYDFVDRLLKQFLSEAHLPTPEPDETKLLINLKNGTFEFVNGRGILRNFEPNDFLTYQLPFEYDPNAVCPLFDKFLRRVLPDESSRQNLQEFSGFIFTNLNIEKCLILLGNGCNGKSVFFNIINALIGKENTLNYPLGLFGHEYNRAKLTNVLLNYSSEKGFDLHPDTFKALISGEPLQARECYGRSFTIYNKVKFIINCNELPRETESTEAYFRRFLIVPFNERISDEEKDIELADKIISKELPGVFNWLLVGLNRIMLQQKFSNCESAVRALDEFRKQSDSCQLFVEENRYVPSANNKEALTDLYVLYKEFCRDDGYKPLGKNRFSMRLEGKGIEKCRMNDGSTAFLIKKDYVHE